MEEDLLLTETGNGGDLVIRDNDLVLTSNLSNQIYLALFGGNIVDDNGEQFNEYWANVQLSDESKYVSQFERTLNEVVINSSGLQRLHEAANKDLEFLKKYVNYTLELSILNKDSISLYIDIKAPNNVENKVSIVWNSTTKTVTSWV